mmetsp:Transcript_85177/g.241347  ORF Transcript_85177/g.241347 Transcript_85177/m.241347 type:complete len:319 (-) Transcript_85177:599-1555(-)
MHDALYVLPLAVPKLLPDALFPLFRERLLCVLPVLERTQLLLKAIETLVCMPYELRAWVFFCSASAQCLPPVHVVEAQLVVDLAQDGEAGQRTEQPEVVELLNPLPLVPSVIPPLSHFLAPLLVPVDLSLQQRNLVDLLKAGQHARDADLVDDDHGEIAPAVVGQLEQDEKQVSKKGDQEVHMLPRQEHDLDTPTIERAGHTCGGRGPLPAVPMEAATTQPRGTTERSGLACQRARGGREAAAVLNAAVREARGVRGHLEVEGDGVALQPLHGGIADLLNSGATVELTLSAAQKGVVPCVEQGACKDLEPAHHKTAQL